MEHDIHSALNRPMSKTVGHTFSPVVSALIKKPALPILEMSVAKSLCSVRLRTFGYESFRRYFFGKHVCGGAQESYLHSSQIGRASCRERV
jgi:hypothetical protein